MSFRCCSAPPHGSSTESSPSGPPEGRPSWVRAWRRPSGVLGPPRRRPISRCTSATPTRRRRPREEEFCRRRRYPPPPPPPPKGILGRAGFLASRRPARVVFAALAILLPALIRNRCLSRADLTAFLVTSLALSVFDGVRREVNHGLGRIRRLKEGWDRHSPPLEELSPRKMLSEENAADRVTLLGVLVNLLLSVGKAGVGVTCHSSALMADAGHSLSDLFSDFITLWAVKIGRLPPDEDHPYGHGKFEAVGSLFLSLTLLVTGVGVGAASNRKLLEILSAQRSMGTAAAAAAIEVPTPPALVMAGLSILSKEWLYRITRRVGDRLNSQIVLANAWHHRTDAYSSVLALVSIGLAIAVPGFLAADAAAGILVAGMICMTGAEILGESVKQLTDTHDETLATRVVKLLSDGAEGDVLEVKSVKTRQAGSSSVVDVSVVTSSELSSSANRAIEERLRWLIMEEPGVLHAEVRAESPEVVCPLLTAAAARGTTIAHPPPVRDVEDESRKILRGHPDVRSVEDVTVHYHDTILMDVDATIR